MMKKGLKISMGILVILVIAVVCLFMIGGEENSEEVSTESVSTETISDDSTESTSEKQYPVSEERLKGYTKEVTADGDIAYVFCYDADGVIETVRIVTPASWEGKCGFNYGEDCVIFYHMDSHDSWLMEGYDGGELFSLAYSKTKDFEVYPDYQYLGEAADGYYYLTFPTDVQGYMEDDAIMAEYSAMNAKIDVVREKSTCTLSGSSVSSGNQNGTGTETVTADGLYKIAESDSFTFECAQDWITENMGDGAWAEKEGTEGYPFYIIYNYEAEEFGQTPGEFIAEDMKEYSKKHGVRVASQPEVVTYEIGDRKVAGYIASCSSEDGSRTITTYRLTETINDRILLYWCEYISQTYNENEYEDETTYFEFMHAIETLKMK